MLGLIFFLKIRFDPLDPLNPRFYSFFILCKY
jgi:hypothetical protein